MNICLSMDICTTVNICLPMSIGSHMNVGLSMNICSTANYWPPVKLSTAPMMPGVISILVMPVPIAITPPIPPMAMEVAVVDSMISWRHTKNIIRWYNHDGAGNAKRLYIYPRSAVNIRPEPATSVEAIPVTSVEIKARGVWH